METKIFTKIANMTGKTGLLIKKHSPEILMGCGIIGTVASTVLACKATLKVNSIINEHNNKRALIKETLENDEISQEEYNEEDSKKDLTIIYTQTGIKLVRLYAPSVALGILSIGSIIAGHKILKKRNIALAAAYMAVDKGFKNYRRNVIERFGEELDKELRYNIKAKEIERTTVDKNGKEKKTKEKVLEIEGNPSEGISEYARFFDEWNSDAHSKDPEYNLMFLRRQQDYANEILKSRGHIFLNEVYDMLGIPRTTAGQAVGWIYDEKNPNGDNYVDFGIYTLNGNDVQNERKMAFVNGQERNILLDFNVDGPILNLI